MTNESKPASDDIETQVRVIAEQRLTTAYGLYAVGLGDHDTECEIIGLGTAIGELADTLGDARVESIVREVERAFGERLSPGPWEDYTSYILDKTHEGRYPGIVSPLCMVRCNVLAQTAEAKGAPGA